MTSNLAAPPNVRDLYRIRFAGDHAFRDAMWKVLCRDFFQRYVGENDTVLEVAAGHCEFINNIRAKRRVAVDINSDTQQAAEAGVEVFVTSSTDLAPIADESIDVVFVSNFFEHLERSEITKTLQE